MAIDIPVLEEIIEGKITTIIADDLEIKGTIKFKSSVMLKGIFEGEIQSEGLLVVGPTARVAATITTKILVSHGEITGNVTAGEQIVLKGTATHNGDVKAPFITIESGAVFNGAATMERRQEAEKSLSAEPYEEKPVVVQETFTYEPFVTQTPEMKQVPFVITQHDQSEKQNTDKTPSKEWEKTEESVDFTETT
jgi:cytoskeletal protein CcmA (bactofilin family)